MARMKTRKRPVRKNGGKHGRGVIKKTARNRVAVRPKKRRIRVKNEPLRLVKGRSSRPIGIAKGQHGQPIFLEGREVDDPLDLLNDDELARELGLGADANEAMARANGDFGLEPEIDHIDFAVTLDTRDMEIAVSGDRINSGDALVNVLSDFTGTKDRQWD